MTQLFLLEFILLSASAWFLPWRRVRAHMSAGEGRRIPHSLPRYHGQLVLMLVLMALGFLWLFWHIGLGFWMEHLSFKLAATSQNALTGDAYQAAAAQIKLLGNYGNAILPDVDSAIAEAAYLWRKEHDFWWNVFGLAQLLLGSGIIAAMLPRCTLSFPARVHVERLFKLSLRLSAGLAIAVTLMILATVLWESIRFFSKIPMLDFIFGTHWSPQNSTSGDAAQSFGMVPLFLGTLLITLIAMAIAMPLGLMAAVYMSEYATPRFRRIAKPVLEVLAGIPTVVYGYVAAISVAPSLRAMGEALGIPVAAESALAAGLVMGVMIIPFVSSLSDDVMHAVPQSLRDGAFALGSTRSEMVCKVLLPAASPGIIGALLLAISRAVGETMIVVMAAGLAANLTFNPLDSVTTVTAQMVALLVGDQEFDSAKTLAAYALGLMLFLITLAINLAALRLVKRYRSLYA